MLNSIAVALDGSMPGLPTPVVGALIFNEGGELFLMQSNGKFGSEWIIPGGKVDFGERMEAALRREIKEETNIDLHDVRFLGVREMIEGVVHFIFLEFSAQASNPCRIVLNEEAVEYGWFAPSGLEVIRIARPTLDLIRDRIGLGGSSWASFKAPPTPRRGTLRRRR